ncbi:MAG: hypothetical protein AB1Z98_25980 [Nannocystaceae bacterium]
MADSFVSRSPALVLAVHGPTAACHELHTAVSGSFDTAAGQLAAAAASGRPRVVATRITRSSCRSLLPMVDWLVASSVQAWVLVWPEVTPARREAAPRMVARLGIAVPHALRAAQRAERRGLVVATVGVPPCTMGPFARLCVPDPRTRRHAIPCDSCPSRRQCSGVDPWYLERFGSEELRAAPTVEHAARPSWLDAELPRAVELAEAVELTPTAEVVR